MWNKEAMHLSAISAHGGVGLEEGRERRHGNSLQHNSREWHQLREQGSLIIVLCAIQRMTLRMECKKVIHHSEEVSHAMQSTM